MVQSWLRRCVWSGSISSASMCSSPVIATGYWCSMIGPLSTSNDATRMYSTWFSVAPRGYCDRSLRGGDGGGGGGGWAAAAAAAAALDSDECCDETAVSVEGACVDLALWLDVRSTSDVAADTDTDIDAGMGGGCCDGGRNIETTRGRCAISDARPGFLVSAGGLPCGGEAELPLMLMLCWLVFVGGCWSTLPALLLYGSATWTDAIAPR